MVRNVIHLGLGQVATTLLTILQTAMLARLLGPAEFGQLFLVSSIAIFSYVVIDWGHGSLIIRETARNPERAGNLLGSAFALRAGSAVVVCVAAVTATWLLGHDQRTQLLVAVLIVAWLPQYLGLSFGWVFRAHERMDRDALLNVMLKLITLVGSAICLVLGGHLFGLMFAWAVAGILTAGIGMAIYRSLELPRLSATLSTARELLHEGAPLFAFALVTAIEPYLIANILYTLSSPEVVGWYGAAWNIAGSLVAPATILGATMYPRLSTTAGDPAEFKRTFEISLRPLLLLAVLGAAGTYLFAHVAVGLIYGLDKFGPAADTLAAFAPVLLLMYVDIFLGMTAVASGKAGRLAVFKVVTIVITTGISLVLVPLCQAKFGNGGLGVMYALTIGELLMMLAATFLIREVADRRMLVNVLRCLAAGAATVLLMRVLPELAPWLAIPLCVVVFGALAVLTGAVKNSDVELLKGSFRKTAPGT